MSVQDKDILQLLRAAIVALEGKRGGGYLFAQQLLKTAVKYVEKERAEKDIQQS